MKKALFLDRDGVINEDKGYVSRIEDFTFCAGVFEALRAFEARGYLLIIVTNQSGIGRGYYTEEAYEILTAWMLEECQKNGVTIAKVYHCPHAPEEGCGCRKPHPGMLEAAIGEFGIDVTRSWMVGDKLSDMEAGKRAGVGQCVLVGLKSEEYPSVGSLYEALGVID
ncbi:MAG: D-glycero-beta-D-manno-heptose 1,7-bisphosphate 7-phosphatase [Campylobacterales bacterium]|nr:D-glycero-beta-D-manno-heptose 1,7-bisphosphate 7-phosphatase [Campylobacterales bacterium]